MKNKLPVLLSFIALFAVVAFLIRFDPDPITDQEVANLSQAIDTVFASREQAQNNTQSNPATANLESIMAIIYRRPDATWFIKARGKTDLVNQQAVEFNRLFVDELKFTDKPDFSHIPKDYLSGSNEQMRIATFNLNGLEVSVTRLGANQDVESNIQRWRGQLNMPESTPQFVKFLDNNNTVLVRLNQPVPQQSAPQPPQQEKLDEFAELPENSNWTAMEASAGMASATFEQSIDGQSYQVAVLRLPANVPLETILGIWKERLGIAAEQSLPTEKLTSQSAQEWNLFTIQNDKNHIVIAMLSGTNRYTFLRLSGPAPLAAKSIDEFKQLISDLKITSN
ncbi:hypothetical protein FLL45_07095 [Aliikangiella marina]|uniref:Uncharacterized protein n=1 Tax=Aliikangiella marina TaxID=1712262 RepID=A0A545TC00_9GAMM|nr:hypothetical protein [Aliikangiella marina]TQV74721.1 hypothetical protein FLL45_07095 [Aliikangiella marina]